MKDTFDHMSGLMREELAARTALSQWHQEQRQERMAISLAYRRRKIENRWDIGKALFLSARDDTAPKAPIAPIEDR